MKAMAKIICCSVMLALGHSAMAAQAKNGGDSAEATREKSKAALDVKHDRKTVIKRAEDRAARNKARSDTAKKHSQQQQNPAGAAQK